MCNIWQKKSVNEMTPDEVALFFERWPQFRWVHLTGGELFMRRDLDDLVAAIQKNCRSLFLLNFPTTGWFGDKTVALVERTLARGVGRLMVTISDGVADFLKNNVLPDHFESLSLPPLPRQLTTRRRSQH